MKNNLLLIVTAVTLLLFPHKNFAQAPDLGVAASFVLFTSGGAFNGDAATSVVGDIGTNAGAFTPPGVLVGSIHIPPDPIAVLASIDVNDAYADLASRICGLVLGTPFGNQTLLPNTYCLGGASVLDGNLTLDGGGNPNALFIFQIDGALSANPLSTITLINGANLCNVYFQVNGAVSLGSNAIFQGTILAAGAIDLGTGAILTGRGLTTAGAISTSANIVTLPASCLVAALPTIACPADVTVSCASQVPVADPATVSVVVTCPGAFTVIVLADVISNQICANQYTITRTYQVTDACGGIAVCAQTITVLDVTPPTITCPANVTVSCASLVPVPNTALVVASDNCGGAVTITFVSDVISNQICANQFTITRTYQVADACGNIAICTQLITVLDLTLPTITCPANVTVSCASLVPVPNTTLVVASDNCGGAVTITFVSDVISNQICANQFTIIRTYQVADACGNIAICTQLITVLDLTLPTITCPANVTVSCASLVPVPNTTLVVASDNCGGAVTITFVSDVISNQICANQFTIIRTYQVADACGNIAICTQLITVLDLTLPTITCPANVVVSCVGLVPAVDLASVIVSDNCGGAVTVVFVGDVISNQTCANSFTITRTYQTTDACGNVAICVQTITVLDLTLPTITCPADVTVSCANQVPAADPASLTVSDNCGGAMTVVFVGDVISNQTCANSFTITRTYQATDACGNVAICVQTITVLDLTLPTITCPADVTVSCANQVPVADPASLTVSDNCGGAVTVIFVGDVISNQICVNRFTITRTYQATDLCGNVAICVQIITVNNLTAATFNCPADVTVSCASLVPVPDPASIVPTNVCGGVLTVTFASDVISNQTCANRFTITRTYQVADACGNIAICTQLITVLDLTLPTITCPADVTVSCANQVPAANPASVTVSDNCGGAVTVIFVGDVISNQICVNRFTITRTYQATDVCGNVAICVQIITVNNLTAATFNCPADVTVSCASLVPVPDPASIVPNNVCGGVLTVSFVGDVISNQICANRFTISRTYQVIDACGNVATCVQTITVLDLTLPTITCPANLTVSCVSLVPVPNTTSVIASDNCGGAVTITFVSDVISNQTCANRFTITRTYQVADACGNIAICTQLITVLDLTLPTITCPANVTVSCASLVPVPNTTSVVASDNCGGAVTITFLSDVISNQTCANRFTITRTYQVADACGNIALCTQLITVLDQTLPTITCPANVTVSCASLVPVPNTTSVIASDNCGGAVTITFVSDVISNQICVNRYTITRTYQVADACGNIALCTQLITVLDLTLPTITCPANVTVSCANQVPAANPGSIIVSDNCGGAVTVIFVSDVISNQICVNRFTITRTYQATDLCGNVAVCVQIITVNNLTAATLNCPADVTVSCASLVPVPDPTSIVPSNVCGGILTVTFVSDVISNQTCANRFTITRTYQVADACGNIAICTQLITVLDLTLPTITCPANVTVSCASLVPVPNTTSVVASDNCGGAVTITFISDVISNQTCANRFTITRTYQVADACGNIALCTQLITVLDQTLPTISCPANVTVSCASLVPVPNTTSVVATDNCGGAVTVTFLSDVISNQTCANRFTITRTYRVADACGNIAICTQTITVNGQTPPSMICPANLAISCSSQMPGADLASIITGDNCGGAVATSWVSDVISNQICANQYNMLRTFQAIDVCGNISTCVQTITMNDQTGPVFTVLPQNLEIECEEGVNEETILQDWLDHFGYAEVIDECGAAVLTTVVLSSNLPQDCYGNGNLFTHVYEFQATDNCGNTSLVHANFSMVDHTPPVIICPPGNYLLTCEHDLPNPDLSLVQAWDNCGGEVKIMLTISSSGTGCADWMRTTNYWYMATDACGNMSTCDQPFQIIDSLPPMYTGPDTIDVGCVDDLPGAGNISGILAPYMTDNCYDIICFGRVIGLNGTNWVTYRVKAKDYCGNWTDKFTVTFVATGICQPLCTATQLMWGSQDGFIHDLTTTEAIEEFMNEHGGVTAGKLGKSITATSVDCVHNLLPGLGNTAQFSPPGKHVFSDDNNCDPTSPLLNNLGSLKNELAANVIAMQFNIWYNLKYNHRSLGVQQLATLPTCLVDAIVLDKMETDLVTVQGLVDLSNNYLAGVGFYPQGFGDLLNDALDNLNNYWQNCQVTDPCLNVVQDRADTPTGGLILLNLAPNPVLDMVTLRFEASATTDLQVRFMNSTGGLQSQSFQQVLKGSNSLSFSTKTFPPGVYTLVLQQGKNLQTLRMVKVED